MKEVNKDPILDIRKAVINGMCRIGMQPEKRLIDAVVDSLPDCFRQPLTAAESDAIKACKDVLAALQKSTAETGEILWLDHVLPGVHESAIERLKSVIED
jgi:hypothetical protein